MGEDCGCGGLRVCGSRGRAFCAGERFAGCRLASSDIALRFATSPDNLQRFLEVAAKKNASVCKTSAASPSTSRNYRSRARLASKTTQSRAHPGRTARTRAFFGSRSANPPFLTDPRAISPSQTLWPTVPQRIAQTRTPSQALLRCIAPSRLSCQRLPKPFAPNQPPTSNPPGRRSANSPSNHQSKPSSRPTAPGTSPQASPPYQQPFRPSDRFRPLTNTPLSHRPGVEGLHGAAPYCVCATPSPSDAPIARGLSPRCAPHRPSSIRS